jgi:RHS repeat-associated protein
VQYNERVSYYGVDGRLAAADARAAGNPGTGIVGHAAFEEYRYDALGRRIMARARRWCEDESGAGHNGVEAGCDLSTIRRTVWSGTSELAEIQMPAADDDDYLTPTDTVENDTLAVHRDRSGVPVQVDYDANRAFGIVLYVHGLSTDQPVAVTRVNYADATDFSIGSTTWKVYAPFSTIPLWNSRGRADRAVMGGTAAPGGDRICEDLSTHDRCVELGLIWGEFSYMILADKLGAWQGTLLVDKADATGTFYRRNRSYDPNTARFTQEDPIGLAGGMNLYGFAAGDPVNYSDPFGLCVPPVATAACAVILAGAATLLTAMVVHALQNIPLLPNSYSSRHSGSMTGTVEKEEAGKGSTGGPSEGRRATKSERKAARARNRAANDGELRCVYCDQETPEEPGLPNSSQIDHVEPRNPSDGGPRGNNDPENLKNACATCNRAKSNKRPPFNPGQPH